MSFKNDISVSKFNGCLIASHCWISRFCDREYNLSYEGDGLVAVLRLSDVSLLDTQVILVFYCVQAHFFRKPVLQGSNQVRLNKPAKPQRLARGLKFEKTSFFAYGKTGTDQLRRNRVAD